MWCGSLLETVEALDTSAFHVGRRLGGVGTAGHDPDMLLALLFYAYCYGARSGAVAFGDREPGKVGR
jgi:hypothetical protein